MDVMIWRLDAGDYEGGIEIAHYGLKHDLATPERFNRDLATLVLETLADQALAHATPEKVAPLETTLDLVANSDMPDEVRTKAHKALARLLEDSVPIGALDHARLALSYNPRCGTKTLIARLEKRIGEEEAQTAPTAR